MTTYFTEMESPVGRLVLTSDGETITGLLLPVHATGVPSDARRRDSLGVFQTTLGQLRAYFEGDLRDFDLPLHMEGTRFQKTVWNELRQIPYGVTISYGELARRVGNANASRAVGLANGRNPVPIIVPCHRVIGANGSLTGYGGGLDCKRALLAHEAGVLGRQDSGGTTRTLLAAILPVRSIPSS